MKKSLFLFLAWGMFVSAFSQHEVSDKWVITPIPTMKGVLGRLDINFPADIERNILIYQQADNKFLRSVSHNDKTYTIAPGEYRFTLTNVPVENVPIKKGHETRIKAGFLDIVSEGDWHLYDETKEKAYTSGNKPKKLPLPVGRYQIKLGGQFYPVVIKDGETVEDYTPVEVNDEPIGKEELKIIETDQVVLTLMPDIEAGQGRIVTKFPLESTDGFFAHRLRLAIKKPGIAEPVYTCGGQIMPCAPSFTLPPGDYDVVFAQPHFVTGTNPIILQNIPVKKGYETRIKAGYFVHKQPGYQKISDINDQFAYMIYLSQGLAGHPFPVGNYKLTHYFVGDVIVNIQDEKITEVSLMDSIRLRDQQYVISELPSKPQFLKNGRLNCSFPEANNVRCFIKIPTPNGYRSDSLENREYYDLPPGNYDVYLNFVKVTMPIKIGKETRIRFGYLNIKNEGVWRIKDAITRTNICSHAGPRKIALPVGYYRFSSPYPSNGVEADYLILIKEGKTLDLGMPAQ